MNSKMLILAGTALGLVMAASQASAVPSLKERLQPVSQTRALPVILAQSGNNLSEQECQVILDDADADAALLAECRLLLEADPAEEPDPEPVEEPAPVEEPEPEPVDEPAEVTPEPVEEPVEEVIEPADEVEEIEEPVIEEEEEAVEEVIEPTAEEVTEPADEIDETVEPVLDDEQSLEDATEPSDLDEELIEEAEPALPADEEAPDEAVAPDEYEDAAPILDSEKEAEALGITDEDRPVAVEDGSPPPASDVEAQAEQPETVESSTAEEGVRVERRVDDRPEAREGSQLVREIGDRIVIQFNNQLIVQSRDEPRLGRDATEVYYEELPRGRTRETVVRPNGVMVVTIRDRYGDVIRRSRILPDGTEYVLVYADDRDRDREGRRQWRDPARDLPPLRLRVPVREYILEARYVEDPNVYYDFLDRPPVERVQRLYSVDEVRYSSRVRDIMPRIELDTLTFDFGSASIGESEVGRLQGVADAMHRLLDANQAEMFLIEGHTDAVGSHEANLALSDRRAEAVALALTDFFDIPPENLVTQGYGKNYLKIETQEPERLNRRVVMRRITPLVTPVASR